MPYPYPSDWDAEDERIAKYERAEREMDRADEMRDRKRDEEAMDRYEKENRQKSAGL
jgi:hypothetical protein